MFSLAISLPVLISRPPDARKTEIANCEQRLVTCGDSCQRCQAACEDLFVWIKAAYMNCLLKDYKYCSHFADNTGNRQSYHQVVPLPLCDCLRIQNLRFRSELVSKAPNDVDMCIINLKHMLIGLDSFILGSALRCQTKRIQEFKAFYSMLCTAQFFS